MQRSLLKWLENDCVSLNVNTTSGFSHRGQGAKIFTQSQKLTRSTCQKCWRQHKKESDAILPVSKLLLSFHCRSQEHTMWRHLSQLNSNFVGWIVLRPLFSLDCWCFCAAATKILTLLAKHFHNRVASRTLLQAAKLPLYFHCWFCHSM